MKIKEFIFLAVFVFLSSFQAWAEEDPAWTADKARLEEVQKQGAEEKISEEEECRITWDILWSWAKKGNLEARTNLFFLINPISSHADFLALPGRSGDDISQTRDAVIMAVHSTGVDYNKNDSEIFHAFAKQLYLETPVKYTGKNFLNCLNSAPSKECTKIAVKEKIVPAWIDYANEVDLFLAQDKKPTCTLHHAPRPKKKL